MITTINTFDGFKLGDNLITSHHVDNTTSALIPAEAVENDQSISSFCSNKVGSKTFDFKTALEKN